MIATCPKCGAEIREHGNDDIVQCPKCRNLFLNETENSGRTIRIDLLPKTAENVDISKYTSGTPDMTPTLTAPLADLHSRYDILTKLAEGGTATVSIAQDKNLRRFVAVKTLHAHLGQNADAVAEFIAEAKVVAQLDHPGIIPVYGLAGRGNDLHLCMKLVNGQTLREHLRSVIANGKDDDAAIRGRIDVFLRVCDAISYAHDRSVLHGDLKPENIVQGEHGEVYVADWGLARTVENAAKKSKTIRGTPRYFAPETVREGKCDTRSEVFTLGLILQEIVTLLPAVCGVGDTEFMEHIGANELLPPFHPCGLRIDKRLAAVIRKATDDDPAKRYPSVAELADDLRCYLADQPVSALPENAFARFARWTSHHRRGMLATTLSVLLVCSALTSIAVYRQLQTTRNAHFEAEAIDYMTDRTTTAASNLDQTGLQIQEQLLALARINVYLLESNNAAPLDAWKNSFRPTLSEMGKSDDAMIYSPYYKRMVSMEHGIYQFAPDADRDKCIDFMRRTYPALRKMRNIVLGSMSGYNFDPADYEKLKMGYLYNGLPVRSVFVGTEDGLKLIYPWRGNYSRKIDPRKRAWYKLARDRRGPVWGRPYMDFESVSGLSIPCSVPIIDFGNKFRGVVGLDLSLNKLVDRILKRGNVGDYVVGKAVINRQGEEVFSSKSKYFNAKFDPAKFHEYAEFDLPLFGNQHVRNRILNSGKEYGTFTAERDGKKYLYSFAYLEVWNMFFVTVADYGKLIAHVEAEKKSAAGN